MSIWILFKIIGSLALLIYGMKVMSEALQKMAGSQLRHILGAMTTNRFTGLMTGMFVTASVQSSTATTVMTVSFVNAGLLTLAQAISVIMGANIGTTFTAWIMTLGFSFNMADVVFPAFFIALLLIYSKKRRYIGDFLFGIAFMFFAISTLGTTGKEMDLSHNQMVIDFFSSFDKDSYLTVFAFLGIGTVLTFCMQSSAALMAITMVLCSSGVLPIYMGIALVLGENIGTTITSNIAAMGANTQARRAAFAHLTFNVFGVLWVLTIFYPFIDMVCGFVGVDPHADHINPARLSVVLAAFHTTFNVCNTSILIWLIPQMERFVCYVIKPSAKKDEDDFRLRYIGGNSIMKTPELSVLEAQKEIQSFAERIHRMFIMVRELLGMKDDAQLSVRFAVRHLDAELRDDGLISVGLGVSVLLTAFETLTLQTIEDVYHLQHPVQIESRSISLSSYRLLPELGCEASETLSVGMKIAQIADVTAVTDRLMQESSPLQ